MSNRRLAEEFILEFMRDLDNSGYNVEKYKLIFKNMTDKDFDTYMKDIRDNKKSLVVFTPMYKTKGITIENNLKIAKKYGLEFFEHLIISGKENTPDYKTPIKYLIIDLPFRRQSQNLIKKISVPEHNKSIDELTFQPTGDSKAARISYPELQILTGMGLESSIDELIRFRGGDRNGFNAYNAMFLRYGNANLKTLNQYSTGVESTRTLKIYLMAMHINQSL
ncbi:MAG: Virion structural protein [uncultured bacterium]|nr:MAG: Virion structural protein [uncultured bacterium]